MKPGPIAKRAAADAQDPNVLAVREHPEGSNNGPEVKLYLRAVGLGPGNPWCAAFCVYRLIRAAEELGAKLPANFPRSGSTVTLAHWASEHSLWTGANSAKADPSRVVAGDLVFFYHANIGRIGHVGIVVGVNEEGIVSVEGNTAPAHSVIREGIGVFKRNRSWEDLGAYGGFARLPF